MGQGCHGVEGMVIFVMENQQVAQEAASLLRCLSEAAAMAGQEDCKKLICNTVLDLARWQCDRQRAPKEWKKYFFDHLPLSEYFVPVSEREKSRMPTLPGIPDNFSTLVRALAEGGGLVLISLIPILHQVIKDMLQDPTEEKYARLFFIDTEGNLDPDKVAELVQEVLKLWTKARIR